MTSITDLLSTKQLPDGFTDLREQGQRSRTPKLRQGGFIAFRQGVMMCQPGAGTVPRYDQRLKARRQALGWAGHIRKVGFNGCRKCGIELWVPFLSSEFLVWVGLGEVGQTGISSCARVNRKLQLNTLVSGGFSIWGEQMYMVCLPRERFFTQQGISI